MTSALKGVVVTRTILLDQDLIYAFLSIIIYDYHCPNFFAISQESKHTSNSGRTVCGVSLCRRIDGEVLKT